MIPPQVYILAANALIAFIASRQNISRELIESTIVDHFGGWNQFHDALTQYCSGVYRGDPSNCEGERLWIEITQEVGKRDLPHAQRVIERTAEFLRQQADLAPYAEPCLEQMRRETPDIGPALACLESAPTRLAAVQGAGAIGGVVHAQIGGQPIWIWIAGAVAIVAIMIVKRR